MTHADLSESCIRHPGTPPSQCSGELELYDARTDSAQAGEGGVDDTVAVDLYRCGYYRQTLVVRHTADGWRLANSYHPDGVVVLTP